MDDVKETLKQYRSQLAQVEAAIQNGQDDQDLLELQKEMKDLIQLTEESLLSYEKSNLIFTYEQEVSSSSNNDHLNSTEQTNALPSGSVTDNQDDQIALFYAELSEDNSHLTKEVTSNRNSIATDDKDKQLALFYAELSENDSDFMKKDKLLENVNTNSGTSSITDIASNDSTAHNIADNRFLLHILEQSDITGIKCQAPFTTEWLGAQYHNAMISNVHEINDGNIYNTQVDVLFLNPAMDKMKPCPYFLDEKCRFPQDTCKYSHGYTVQITTLKTYTEPNYESVSVGCCCIAKKPDGLWDRAVVENIEDLKFSVRFSNVNLTCTVNIDELLPLDDDDGTSDENDSDHEEVKVTSFEKTTGSASCDEKNLGVWEKHTKGFASKLMLKLGYEPGKGLGKDHQGRVQPVPIIVLPPGKSLDQCMILREKNVIKHKSFEQSSSSSAPTRKKKNVFSFLNKTLGDKSKVSNTSILATTSKDNFGISGNQSKVKNLSKELLKNDSIIKSTKQNIARLKEQIARNKIRNPSVAAKLQVKLNKALSELSSLQSTTKAIELHQSRAHTHQQMTRF